MASMQVGFLEATRLWLRIGLTSFGGPAGQIALLHRELVERRRWLDEERFLHALDFCVLLPGPEAQQLATYSGWLLHGKLGGFVAGTLFVLPSALLLWALAWIHAAHGDVAWVAALFAGLQPAVLALIAAAIPRIGRRALRTPASYGLALAAFLAMAFADVSFPWVVLGAAAFGWFRSSGAAPTPVVAPPSAPVSLRSTFATAATCLGLWWAPVVLAGLVLGWNSVLAQEGLFFSKSAVVTFGGAYAVLPYVADSSVHHFGWLSAADMLDGLGLAETTPGPLIMVVQFVGFLGAWNDPGEFSPLASATLGAALTTWVTFVPCFLFVFVGAPYVERLRGIPRLSGALAAITAAVVGGIAQLALWFAAQTLFDASGAFDVWAAALALGSFGLLHFRRWEAAWVVALCGAVGLARHFLGS
jgi:chromate transporter